MKRTAYLALVFLLSPTGMSFALTLDKVRVGQHRYFSRVVLDFDRPLIQYRLYRGSSGRTLWVVTPAEVKSRLALPTELPRDLTGLSLASAGREESRLRVGVADGSEVRSFILERDSYGPHRLVVDILRPTPAERLARIEGITYIPGRPWRPVGSFSPAAEIQSIRGGRPSSPPRASRPAPPRLAPSPPPAASPSKGAASQSTSKMEARPMAPPLKAPSPPPAKTPNASDRPLLQAQKPPTPAATQSANKNTERRPKKSGFSLNRLGRYLTGANLNQTLSNVHGPIPLRFNNPLHVFLYQFIPERAELLPRGEHALRLDFNQSHELGQLNAVNEGDGTSPIDPSVPLQIFVHMEVSAFRLHYDYGIFDWLQAGIEVPVLYHHVNSFANELKEAYEKYISGKRSLLKVILNRRPDLDSTRFFIVDGDKTLFDSDTDSAGLGEMALRAKFRILPESTWIPATSFRAGLKLPTATDDQFGSGGVDGALSLLFEKNFWDSFIVYFNYSLTIPSDPFDSENLNPQDYFTYWTMALEWYFLKRWALVGQFSALDSPYEAPPGTQEDTSLTELIAAPSYVMGGGLRVALDERWMVMGGFQTDVVGRVGATADETSLFISLGYRIPSKRSKK